MAQRRLDSSPPPVGGGGRRPAAQTSGPSRHPDSEFNSDFSWDEFDSSWYYDHNYKVLRDDDRQIIEVVRDFFATLELSSRRHGIDVGSGTNLYPALTMLPFCETITLYEYSTSNVSWLQREVRSYSSSWDAFWQLLAKDPPYKSVNSPQQMLAMGAHVEQGSVFDLPESRWDIGTMFFTAESISSAQSEFQAALGCFVKSLRLGAPFAVAFMERSLGYNVGAHRFPAVAITASEVREYLEEDAEGLEIHQIGLTSDPLRTGYDGMILATGRIAGKN